jgi:hypothetical protein
MYLSNTPRSKLITTTEAIQNRCRKQAGSEHSRGGGGVVEANGVVVAGGDEEVVLAVEIQAVYLPGLTSIWVSERRTRQN